MSSGDQHHVADWGASAMGAIGGFMAPFEDFAARVASGVVTGVTVAAILALSSWIRSRIARKERR